MNNKTKKFNFTFILFITLLFWGVLSFPLVTHANSIQPPNLVSATESIELANCHVYRVKPNWWYIPNPSIFSNPTDWHGPTCTRRCIVNQYGSVIRCQTGCY